MEKPPVITEPTRQRNYRFAWTLNLLIPGTGQLMMGQIVLGTVLCLLFVVDFVALMGIFLKDFSTFLQLVTGGKILEGDTIEQASKAYHVTWMLTLLGIGLVIYIISFVTLVREEQKSR